MREGKDNPYEVILDHPHFVSRKYPSMSMEKRAAQFLPFKAMVGYDDEVEETARFTDDEIFVDENRLEELDERLRAVAERIAEGERPFVKIRHFVPDKKKAGGSYVVTEGRVRRIDETAGRLVMRDGSALEVAGIVEIEMEQMKQWRTQVIKCYNVAQQSEENQRRKLLC